MTDKRRYTMDEATRELARRECSTHGHSWDVIQSSGGIVRRIVCGRCGRSGRVSMDEKTSGADQIAKDRDAGYEAGYADGESSMMADWIIALDDVLPDDFEVTPSAVARYLAESLHSDRGRR